MRIEKDKKPHRCLRTLLETPPCEWEKLADEIDIIEGRELGGELEKLGQQALLLCEYLSTRLGGDGCGLKTHEDAANEVHKLNKKVRKALGYTYTQARTISL